VKRFADSASCWKECAPLAESVGSLQAAVKSLSQQSADSTSNNLVEAGNGSTDADFLNKMRLALREAKQSKACLQKIHLAALHNAARITELGLVQEADELCAIFSSIITNMERRLARGRKR
jgi:four helix bundle protein